MKEFLDDLLLVDTPQQALRRIRWGGGIALACAVLTLFGSIAGDSGFGIRYGLDLWNLIDVFILVVLAVGVFLKNRLAAAVLLIWWIFNIWWSWSQYGIPQSTAGFLISIGIIYVFIEGLRGVCSHHRFQSPESSYLEVLPNPKRQSSSVNKILDGVFLVNSLPKAVRRIRWAGGVALASGLFTFFYSIMNETGFALPAIRYDLNMWSVLDGFFLIGLAVGVFLKSRIAAVVLVVYWVVNKWVLWSAFGFPPLARNFLISAGMLYVFVEGLRGVCSYHKFQSS